MNDITWLDSITQLAPSPSPNLSDWLTKPYILSKALKRCCESLTVEVISQDFKPAYASENAVLNQDPQNYDALPFIRRVFLKGDNKPLTYGRVVIPFLTYQTHFQKFAQLGNQLLGETLLYNNPDSTRSAFEFAALPMNTPLAKEIAEPFPSKMQCETLFGRRSIFYLKGLPLLVNEIFLPTLGPYPEEK